MVKIRELLKNNKGEVVITTMMIIFVLMLITAMVGEVLRLHSLQSYMEYEIQRGVNIAVEDAMMDSFRRDKRIRLNLDQAENNLYAYLDNDMGINMRTMEKYEDGRLIYSLHIDKIEKTVEPPRLRVVASVMVHSAFATIFSEDIKIPIVVASKNVRVD